MATVYLAHDLQLDRRIAIKLMHPTLTVGSDMVERFILEARTAAGLSHHNIVPIYAVKVQEDLLYFVMKYIEGRPLDSIIRAEAPLGADMVRQIMTQVADALAYAHRHGVDSPRYQACQHHHLDGGPADSRRLRHRQGGRQARPHPHGRHDRDADVHESRAVRCPAGHRRVGSVLPRGDGLRGADWKAAVRFAQLYDHHDEADDRAGATGQGTWCRIARATSPNTIDRMLAKEPAERFATMDEVVEALRSATVSSQQTVQTQLVEFALADPRRELVKRVSTPQSPIPTAARRARVATESNVPAAPSRNRPVRGRRARGRVGGRGAHDGPAMEDAARTAIDSTHRPVPPATAAGRLGRAACRTQDAPAAPAEPATGRQPGSRRPRQPATVPPANCPVDRQCHSRHRAGDASASAEAARCSLRCVMSGDSRSLGRAVAWTSSATDVASVDAAGRAAGARTRARGHHRRDRGDQPDLCRHRRRGTGVGRGRRACCTLPVARRVGITGASGILQRRTSARSSAGLEQQRTRGGDGDSVRQGDRRRARKCGHQRGHGREDRHRHRHCDSTGAGTGTGGRG